MAGGEQPFLPGRPEEALAECQVDLLCGGFPCQPVSLAGARRAQADDRWLWPEFLRCIRLLRPRYVLIENVPGLLTANGGRAFNDVLSGLAESGYDAEWDCLPAGAFGAPHKRERIWILAYPMQSRLEGGIGRPADRLLSLTEFPPPPLQEWYSRENYVPRSFIIRSHYGIPDYVDRIKSLGNAIVPQIAEALGRMILQTDATEGEG